MTGPTEEQRNKLAEQHLRFEFGNSLAGRVSRQNRVRVHQILPLDFFLPASNECRDMFVAGHFYGCISLVQALAEGLVKFVEEKNPPPTKKKYHLSIAGILKDRGVISEDAVKALRRIHGNDRNDFHHLNKDIEQGRQKLEQRAEECMNALYVVESEIFAYTLDNGVAIIKDPRYWPPAEADGSRRAYFDFT